MSGWKRWEWANPNGASPLEWGDPGPQERVAMATSRGRSLIVHSSISVSLVIGPALQISLVKKASVSRQDLVPTLRH